MGCRVASASPVLILQVRQICIERLSSFAHQEEGMREVASGKALRMLLALVLKRCNLNTTKQPHLNVW